MFSMKLLAPTPMYLNLRNKAAAGTSDGVVHHFVFRSNNELYTNVLENLPKSAIAVSPWGDVIISSSRHGFTTSSSLGLI